MTIYQPVHFVAEPRLFNTAMPDNTPFNSFVRLKRENLGTDVAFFGSEKIGGQLDR